MAVFFAGLITCYGENPPGAPDLDGDGRLDLIAAGRATKNIIIYWNKTSK